MKILFLDAYFEPEITAYTHLEKDLLEGLTNENYYINIICPMPTRGIDEKVIAECEKTELMYNGKVQVTRFSAPREKHNPLIRAFRYILCNVKTYLIAIKSKDIDAVFSNSTPPTQGFISAMVAKKLSKKYHRKVPFIYNLQDIFPDSLVNTNLTKEGSLIWKIGNKVANYIYNNADKIIVISESFKNNILKKGVSQEKIEVVSNWIDTDSINPVDIKNNTIIDEFQIDPDKFLVVYAGNFGAAQGADIIIDVAKQLTEFEDIQFVIFGGGAYFNDTVSSAKDLPNVFIHELLPQNRVSEVYSLGDVAVITCKPGTGNAGLPSKTWSIMACNTPIIASFDTDSDLADILKDSKAGCCVEPGSVNALKDAILEFHNKRIESINSREYVCDNASKNICVEKYINCFKKASNEPLSTKPELKMQI